MFPFLKTESNYKPKNQWMDTLWIIENLMNIKK